MALLCLFASCRISVEVTPMPTENYPDSSSYKRGGADLDVADYPIESLDIDWVNGTVNIAYHDEQTISFSESANHSLKSSWKLHYHYDSSNDVLNIKYCESGIRVDSDIRKDLTVYLPKDYKLPFLDIDVASADCLVSNIYCDDINYDAASGDADFNILGTISYLEADTASGNITINCPFIKDFEMDSASGDFELKCTEKAPDAFEIDMASGDIVITIPDNSGFRLNYAGMAKSFVSTDFPVSVKGNKYTYGDGSRVYEIDGAATTVTFCKYVAPAPAPAPAPDPAPAPAE